MSVLHTSAGYLSWVLQNTIFLDKLQYLMFIKNFITLKFMRKLTVALMVIFI